MARASLTSARSAATWGYRPLEPTDDSRLEGFLRTKVAQTGSTTALMDAAEAWLLSEGLLRPAATTLERLVRHVRATAEEELFPQTAAS